MVIGLMGACLVAIVRILTHGSAGAPRRRRDEREQDED
jgi:hypothetical protein